MKKIFALFLCAVLLLALAACSKASNSVQGQLESQLGSENTESGTQETSGGDVMVDEAEDEQIPEEPSDEENKPLAIGESAELGTWSISVTGFEFSTKIDNGYSYFEPDAGNQYGIVSVSVTNNGTQADSFLPSFGLGDDVSGKLLYNEEYEYSSTQLLGYDADLHDEFLNPLSSASGVIVFELPEVVVNGAESLTINFNAGVDSTSFALR